MKTEKFDYILFAGETKDNLQPVSAWKTDEEADRDARLLQARHNASGQTYTIETVRQQI